MLHFASPSLVCVFTGLTPRRLRELGARNKWTRRAPTAEEKAVLSAAGESNSLHTLMLYVVPTDVAECILAQVDTRHFLRDRRLVFPQFQKEAKSLVTDQDVLNLDEFIETSTKSDDGNPFQELPPGEVKDAPYERVDGKYVFNLPSKPRSPWAVDDADVEMLVAAYSREGDNATLNQLARRLGWSRKTVQEVLKALGKTHDSIPYTDERIEVTDEEDLVEDLVRRKEERVHIRAERKHWNKTKELADKARTMEQFIRQVFSAAPIPPAPPPPKQLWVPRGKRLWTAVSHPSDAHVGKAAWDKQVGVGSYLGTTREKVLAATQNLLSDLAIFGAPEEAILGVGGDWFHIDNPDGKTTRGTPQDHDGSMLQIFVEGCALARDYIEAWRQVTRKVRVVGVRGNHDYYLSAMLVHWLQAVYRSSPDVEIGDFAQDRTYVACGNTLLGFTHGETTKPDQLVPLMATEATEMWARSAHRMWLTGHWHTQKTDEKYGVLLETLPSLASSDAWHKAHGYVGNRQLLMAHIVDHTRGPVAKVWASP